MRREAALAAGTVAVLVSTLVAALLVPGILAQPLEDDLRPVKLGIAETTISAGHVGGETATLQLQTYLVHAGGTAENVTILYRAVDLETGLVATRVTQKLGQIEGDGERAVTQNLTVEREGGYRIETIIFEEGTRVAESHTQVEGVGTLQPAYAESPVRFRRFERLGLPTVQYAIADVTDNRTTLRVSTYLTNGGDEPAGDLRVVVLARQADSKIVADEASIDIGRIRPGRTDTPTTTLTVPTGYNYYLDAFLWRDGVIVDTTRSAANLNPTVNISVNETRQEIGLQVGDFERDRRERGKESTPAGARQTASAGPGFGIASAVVCLLGGVLLARRWSA